MLEIEIHRCPERWPIAWCYYSTPSISHEIP